MFDIVKTQQELAAMFAPAGQEGELVNKLSQLVAPYADECSVDALGNLIVRKKGAGKKILLSAHMDSIGMVVTHIDEKGFVRFCPLGGIALDEILHKTVVFQRGIQGVVSVEEKVQTSERRFRHAYIDIGASNAEEAGKLVSVGDAAVYKADTYLANGRLVSTYLDDRIGCVILLQVLAMLNEPLNDMYFLFSAQEEIGARGAKTAAYGIEPELALAVDVTAAGDTPEPRELMNMKLGKGAAIKCRDNSIMVPQTIISWLETLAAQANIPVQREVLPFGGSDAGPIHISRAGVPTGGVSIPIRYCHTPAEMAALEDIEACVRLLTAVANSKAELY